MKAGDPQLLWSARVWGQLSKARGRGLQTAHCLDTSQTCMRELASDWEQ